MGAHLHLIHGYTTHSDVSRSLEPAISPSPESDAFLPQNFGAADYLLDIQSLTVRLHNLFSSGFSFLSSWFFQCVILVSIEAFIVHLLSYLFTGWSPALGNKVLKYVLNP